MEGFTKTIPAEKLPSGSMMTIDVNGEQVLLCNVDGKFYGMGALCNHEQWDLSEGVLEGTTVTCAGHGTIWDLKTGKGEFDEPLDNEPLYEVRESEGFLFVKKA